MSPRFPSWKQPRLVAIAGLLVLGPVASLCLGCGGSAPKYKVDDVALAQVPVSEKQAVFAAENEISVAKSERQKAEADARATEDELAVADKEKEQAKLEREKMKLERDTAERSHDQTRIGAAQRAMKVADLGERAATAKSDYLSSRRSWQRALVDVADQHAATAASRAELEKAKIAVAKNIKPSADFSEQKFYEDFTKREKSWAESKKDADEKKVDADKAEQSWKDLRTEWTALAAQK